MKRNGTQTDGQVIEGQYLPANTGGGSHRRRFRLTNARSVRRELAAIYAELRNGEIDPNTVRTGAFVLRCLLESIRADEFESRLAELERKAQ